MQPLHRILAVLVVFCFIFGTYSVASADDSVGPESIDVSFDRTGHQVEYYEDSAAIQWSSTTPQTGWVEYGFSPDLLEHIAYDDAGRDAPVFEHRILLSHLVPGSPFFYTIVIDGERVTKDGEPFVATLPNAVTVQPAADGIGRYLDDTLGLSFVIPQGGYAQIIELEGEEGHVVEVWLDDLHSMLVSRNANAEGLSVEQWFEAHRADYHATATRILGAVELGPNHALIIAQPFTCEVAAMLKAFVGNGGYMYEVSLYELGDAELAPDFASIVGSLRFDLGYSVEWQPLPSDLATFPVSTAHDCEQVEVAEVDAAARCVGADMSIPSPGRMGVPWSCFGNSTYCYPYLSNYCAINPSDTNCLYYQVPHRGLDIFGTENSAPVYATYDAVAYKVNVSNIRLEFKGPYAGKSAWLAHMASSNGASDYRRIVSGQTVYRGAELGKVGNYRTGAAGPHLHISYLRNSTGTETWPTLDPTKFLGAKYLVWYTGWTTNSLPVTCSSSSADGYEASGSTARAADNFRATASTYSVGSGSQWHDFHVPSDEDWIKFTAYAGRGYRIMTHGLSTGNDTYLSLHRSDGYLLTSNDDKDGTRASRIDWIAPTSGTYYVRVVHFSSWVYANWQNTTQGSNYSTPAPYPSRPVFGPNTGYYFRIITNVAYQRSAYATSTQSGYPAANANDGTAATRWSSSCSLTYTQEDWWWTDIGNAPYNEVYVNFETAHPTLYFLCGWNDGETTCTGSWYSVTSPGLYRHLVGNQQKRYFGIKMTRHKLPYCNYSIWEASVYRSPNVSAAQNAAEDVLEESAEPFAILQTPVGEPATMAIPKSSGQQSGGNLYLPTLIH